jgi:hypothetical protein
MIEKVGELKIEGKSGRRNYRCDEEIFTAE